MEKKQEAQAPQKKGIVLFEWLDNILFALVFVILLLTFVFKTFTVEGTSMNPTLKTGDFVFAYSFFYTPQQGDIVLIDSSNNYGKPLIKRVVATAGQTVDIKEDGTLLVDGVVFAYDGNNPNNFRGNHSYPLVVPDDCVFVMGDNRGNSSDSRYESVGFIDERSIVGKEVYVIKH